jgi:hypothetical protein
LKSVIEEFTTSGKVVDRALVSGLNGAIGIGVVPGPVVKPLPDSGSTWLLLLHGLTATFALKHLYRRA